MTFESQALFSLLLLIPILFGLLIWSEKNRKANLAEFIAPKYWPKLLPPQLTEIRLWKQALLLFALALLITALARPQYGSEFKTIERQSLDILIAVDTSYSMSATDIKPSRLDFVKTDIKNLIDLLEGDRIAIITFASTARRHLPLTNDYPTAKLFASDLNLNKTGSTKLGSVINTAITYLKPKKDNPKILIIYTDGEFFDKDLQKPIEKANKTGLKILTIGIGSPDGEPLPIKDETGTIIAYKRDQNGTIVLSKQNDDILKTIAQKTAGTHFSQTGNTPLAPTIYKRLSVEEQTQNEKRLTQNKKDRYHVLAALAALLITLALALPIKLKKHHLILLLLLTPSPSHALFNPEKPHIKNAQKAYTSENYQAATGLYEKALIESPQNPTIRYNLANAYYKSQNYKKARTTYTSILGTTKTPDILYLNIGNSHLQENNPEDAITAYKQGLKVNPTNQALKHNLELAQKQQKNSQNNQKNKENNQKGNKSNQKQQKKSQTENTDSDYLLNLVDALEKEAREKKGQNQNPVEIQGEAQW